MNLSKSLCSLHHRILILASPCLQSISSGYTSESLAVKHRRTLSPYLFALVMDEVTRDIQGDIPLCMLFADDVVLDDESRIVVNRKLELWRRTLESKRVKT